MEVIQAVLEVKHFGAIPEVMVSQECMCESFDSCSINCGYVKPYG